MVRQSRQAVQLFRYGLSSLLSFCLTLGFSEAFRLLDLGDEVAFAITLATMICINFTMCRIWIFRGSDGSIHRQFVAFVLSSLGFRTSEFLVFLTVYTWMGMPYTPTVVLILGASAIAKFFFLRGAVFRQAQKVRASA